MFRQGSLVVLALTFGGSPIMAQQSTISPNQTNDNMAVSQPSNQQQNQSRSESIGGSIYNTQINPAQGDLGEMTVGARAISCQSPSFYANMGVIPYDNQYFGTFDDNSRDKDWMPTGSIGIQLPFGPQVASCINAMKNQALQTQMTTESGVLTKCLETFKLMHGVNLSVSLLSSKFPGLSKHCEDIWANAKIEDKDG